MFDAFFIVLRETAELALCAAALAACLRERGVQHLVRYIARGIVLGAALALVAVHALSGFTPSPVTQALLTAAFGLTMMALAVGMLSSFRSLRSSVEASAHGWLDRACHPATIVAFMAVIMFREAVEVAVFLGASSADPSELAAGAVLGLVALALLVHAARSSRSKVGFAAAFRVSALLLALISAGLIVGSLKVLVGETGIPDGWLYALAMAYPVMAFARGWWRESSAS